MTKTICLFNHKGGVSKTTSVFNIGWVLAEARKRVLMVDLDPQCNLSGLVLGYSFIDDDQLESFYLSRKNLTLYPIVEAIKNGGNPDSIVMNEKGEITKTNHKNLFLLPGHINTSELDTQINVAINMTGSIVALKNIPGALPKIVQTIATDNNIDYIIYDLSPGINALNEVVLMSSDYFIVPSSPDFFCLQAINSLKKFIPAWHAEIASFKSKNNFTSETYPIRNNQQFLGLIQQRYRPRSGNPNKSLKEWMDTIRDAVNFDLVPALKKIKCVVAKEKILKSLQGSELSPYDLAYISDFNSLITISYHVSKPIFVLTDDDIEKNSKFYGIVKQTACENRDKFLETFTKLGKRILQITS